MGKKVNGENAQYRKNNAIFKANNVYLVFNSAQKYDIQD